MQNFITIIFLIVTPHINCFSQETKSLTFTFTQKNIVGGYNVKNNNKTIKSALFIDKIFFSTINKKGFLEFNIFPDGYEPTTIKLQLDTLKVQNSYKINLIEKVKQLNEVVVTSKRNRFVKDGDTLRVFVEDIKTKPHAEASELFDQIAGLENNENGSYKVFGKNIDIVMIDGKRIYSGNPQLTLSMIKADMIKSIDIIEQNLTGNKKKVLNLRLKPDKKKGFYGNVGLGVGSSNSYDFGFKANTLLKEGIFSSFGNANNVSLLKQRLIIDNASIEEFYQKNTFFGYQNQPSINQNQFDNEDISQGIPKNLTLGASTNIESKKGTQVISILLDNNQSSYSTNTFGTTQTEATFIETKNLTSGTASKGLAVFDYSLLKKYGKTNTFLFNISSKLKNAASQNIDSVLFKNGILENQFSFNSNRTSQANTVKLDLGTSIGHKDKKIKTLIFSSIVFDKQHSFTKVLGISNNVKQDINHLSLNSEIVQSYPVSKRVLIENRLSILVDQTNLDYRFQNANKTFTSQYLSRLDNWIYYQQGEVLVNANVAVFRYNVQNSVFQTPLNAIRLRKINLKLPKNEVLKDFVFNYENDLLLPQNLDRIGIADSLNFYFRQVGNQALTPFFKQKMEVSYSNTNLQFINLISSLSLFRSKNSVQNKSYFMDDLLLIRSNKNINNPLNTIDASTFLNFKQLPKGLEMSLSHLFSFGQAYSIFEGQVIADNGMSNYLNFQTTLKGKKALSIKNSLTGTLNCFQSVRTQLIEHNVKINFNIKNQLYSKVSLRSFLGSSIHFQPILNFEFEKFIAKNKIGLEFKIINAIGINSNTIVSQSLFQQTLTQSNNIPRIFLLKLNLFPEKWKK